MHQHMLGYDQLGSRLAEKDLQVLMQTKLNMSQQCIHVAEKADSTLSRIRRRNASR